jgi:hypothetical protein
MRVLVTTRGGTVLRLAASAGAQYYQTDFPPEEFRARHAKVFERICASGTRVRQ